MEELWLKGYFLMDFFISLVVDTPEMTETLQKKHHDTMGYMYSRKNPHTPTDGMLEILAWGLRALEIRARGGVWT